jgi:hypothetical protein
MLSRHIDSNMTEKQNLMVELIRTREHIMHLRSTYERKIGDLEGEMRAVAEQSHRTQAELEAPTMTAAEREPKSKLLDQVCKESDAFNHGHPIQDAITGRASHVHQRIINNRSG